MVQFVDQLSTIVSWNTFYKKSCKKIMRCGRGHAHMLVLHVLYTNFTILPGGQMQLFWGHTESKSLISILKQVLTSTSEPLVSFAGWSLLFIAHMEIRLSFCDNKYYK